MTAPRFIVIDAKPHLWRDIVQLRREQLQQCAEAAGLKQLTLFELREDGRPAHAATAASRYLEPSLFDALC